ncbi:hypothetical protein ACU4GD_43460 [Cupriavidus basilensis]
MINDAPLSISDNGGQVWGAEERDGKFEGPMTMRRALAKSRTWCRCASCAPSAPVRPGLHHALSALTPKAPGLPADGAGRRQRHRCRWLAPTPSLPTAATAVNPYLIQKVVDARVQCALGNQAPARRRGCGTRAGCPHRLYRRHHAA